MKYISIPEYRIVNATETGIGWFAVEKWEYDRYVHITSFRSEQEAKEFIDMGSSKQP
jgi:hypothetical protein